MSKRVHLRGGDLVILEPEPDRACELCGSVEECRPYGPGGKWVCYDCGMKDEPNAQRLMRKRLYSENIH